MKSVTPSKPRLCGPPATRSCEQRRTQWPRRGSSPATQPRSRRSSRLRRKGKRAVDAFYKKQAAEYQRNVAAQDDALRRERAASDQLQDTRHATSGHTKRLQKFIDLINANNIRRFTKYSADNWPGNPDEFYAEAYSLWLADPTFLRTNYPVVHNFFSSGDYLR